MTNLFSENDPAPIRKGAPFPESDLFRGYKNAKIDTKMLNKWLKKHIKQGRSSEIPALERPFSNFPGKTRGHILAK